MISELITNGLLIKKRLKELRSVKRLCISVDGYAQFNDLNRGKGTYQRIMENIDYACRNGLNIYRIESTFTRNNANLENLKFLAKLSEKLNCVFTPFTALVTDYNASDEYRAVAIESQAELVEFWQKVMLLKREGYNIHFNELIIDNVVNMPSTVHERYDKETTEKLGLPFCTFGRLSCYIDTDGQMYPCVPLFGLKGRNIYQYSIKECWESFNDLDCFYCFIGGFCSFGRISMKSILHLVKVYTKYLMKPRKDAKTNE
jgi:MoaA/NifB/PqqE/SkfB family radical SAM enzyme